MVEARPVEQRRLGDQRDHSHDSEREDALKQFEMAQAIGPKYRNEVVGIRAGEKLHEEMITASDALHTVDELRSIIREHVDPEFSAS